MTENLKKFFINKYIKKTSLHLTFNYERTETYYFLLNLYMKNKVL